MAWLLTSDWHLHPGEKMPNWTKKDFPTVTDIVLVGDMIDVLPLGLNQWRTTEGRTTIESIARLTEVAPVHYIFGNHEGRLSWLKLLFEDYPEVQISRDLQIEINSEKWWIEHGHKYTEWRLLRYIADDIVEWLTTNPITRRLWYNFCVRMHWLPGRYHNTNPTPQEENEEIRQERYEEIVIVYWALLMRAARRRHMGYIVGHSHTRATIEPPYAKVLDLGAKEKVLLP
jgi:UDP-2,3-diacylglucosamine pyrophosphatase LpxH